MATYTVTTCCGDQLAAAHVDTSPVQSCPALDLTLSVGDTDTAHVTLQIAGSRPGHAMLIDWGDGSGPDRAVGPTDESEDITLTHTYTATGTYNVKVSDLFLPNCAPISAPVTVATGAKLPTPTGLAISDLTNTTVSASWDAVPNASGYTAVAGPVAGGESVTGTVSGTTATFTGLVSGTAYGIAVFARGDGVQYTNSDTATVTFTTPNLVLTLTDRGGLMGQIVVDNVDPADTSVNISFDAVGNPLEADDFTPGSSNHRVSTTFNYSAPGTYRVVAVCNSTGASISGDLTIAGS